MRTTLLMAVAVSACASGPRPVPQSATAAERLELMETVLKEASRLSATVEISSKAVKPDGLKGTLTLGQGAAAHVTLSGVLGNAKLELDYNGDGDEVSRTVTKGSEASSHREPLPSAQREAVGVGLVRQGLRSVIEPVSREQPLEFANGGVGQGVRVVSPTVLGVEALDGQSCTRVSFSAIRPTGTTAVSICIGDKTALPLERREGAGVDEVVEHYVWQP